MASDRDQWADKLTGESGGWLTGFLAEEDEFDRRALWRLGSWAVGSVVAVIVALMVNQYTVGWRREQVAAADLTRQTQQIQWVAKESQNETRRLATAVDTLNSDRDRLYSRVTVLEQGLETVTGSIGRQGGDVPEPAPPPPSATSSATASTRSAAPPADDAAALPQFGPPAPSSAPQPPALPSMASQTVAPATTAIAKNTVGLPDTAARTAPPATAPAIPAANAGDKSDKADKADKSDKGDKASVMAELAPDPAAHPPAAAAPLPSPSRPEPTNKASAAAIAATPATGAAAPASANAAQATANAAQATATAAPATATAAQAITSAPLMPVKSIMAPPDPAATRLTAPDAAAATGAAAASPPSSAAETPAPKAAADAAETQAAPAIEVQRTEFGIDLGGANSIEGLRALWRGLLRYKTNRALAELRPIIVVKERGSGLGMQLRLVAGPLNDAAVAAKLCATLTENDRSCETTVFDGQRLAIKGETGPSAAAPPAVSNRRSVLSPARSSRRRAIPSASGAGGASKVEEPEKPPPPPAAEKSSLSSILGLR